MAALIECDEPALEVAAREFQEEFDRVAERTQSIGVYPIQRQIIIADHLLARGEIVLNEELAEYRLIPPEKLQPQEHGTRLAVCERLLQKESPDREVRASAIAWCSSRIVLHP